jgi:hypothetical protein
MNKIIVNWVTQMSVHSLKLHFCMFEKSQGKHNSLKCYNIFKILYAQSLTQIKNVFACSKHSKIESEQFLFFFKHHFFLSNLHHSFWKLKRILTLMIRITKGFELIIIFFVIHLNTFGSKMYLTLKMMNFENVALTKVVHIYVCECVCVCVCVCDRGRECIIYMI